MIDSMFFGFTKCYMNRLQTYHIINHCNEIMIHNKFLPIENAYTYSEKVGNIWIIIVTWKIAKYIVSL